MLEYMFDKVLLGFMFNRKPNKVRGTVFERVRSFALSQSMLRLREETVTPETRLDEDLNLKNGRGSLMVDLEQEFRTPKRRIHVPHKLGAKDFRTLGDIVEFLKDQGVTDSEGMTVYERVKRVLVTTCDVPEKAVTPEALLSTLGFNEGLNQAKLSLGLDDEFMEFPRDDLPWWKTVLDIVKYWKMNGFKDYETQSQWVTN